MEQEYFSAILIEIEKQKRNNMGVVTPYMYPFFEGTFFPLIASPQVHFVLLLQF